MAEDSVRIGADALANSGQEQKITPITFSEFISRLKRPQFPSKEQREAQAPPFTGYSFGRIKQDDWQPALVATFNPPLFGGRGYDIRYRYYGINSSGTDRVEIDEKGEPKEERPYTFHVYDASLKDLTNNSFLDDIEEIDASKVLVAGDSVEASKIGSWVADSTMRAQINEYANAQGRLVEKYIQLRRAPFETKSVPGFGKYTYQDVIQATTKEVPMFTTEDLEWIKTFMKNKGIPIPTAS